MYLHFQLIFYFDKLLTPRGWERHVELQQEGKASNTRSQLMLHYHRGPGIQWDSLLTFIFATWPKREQTFCACAQKVVEFRNSAHHNKKWEKKQRIPAQVLLVW